MNIYVYSAENRQLLGIVESFEYLRWTRRYSKCGDFEMKAIATFDNVALLKIGAVIVKSDDDEAAIIETVELNQTENEFISVGGRFLTSLLARRIAYVDGIISDEIGSVISDLLTNNILNPTNIDRKIPQMILSVPDTGITITDDVVNQNLMEIVCDICTTADLGIKTRFIKNVGVFNILLYEGQIVPSPFAKEYENILEQVFTDSIAECGTFALVNGTNLSSWVGEGVGLERFEILVDAEDIDPDSFSSGEDYEKALQYRGKRRLAASKEVQSFEVAINPHGNLKYKVDFDLGDEVCALSKKWGISMNSRITEVTETYDRDGLSVDLTLGKAVLTLSEKLNLR